MLICTYPRIAQSYAEVPIRSAFDGVSSNSEKNLKCLDRARLHAALAFHADLMVDTCAPAGGGRCHQSPENFQFSIRLFLNSETPKLLNVWLGAIVYKESKSLVNFVEKEGHAVQGTTNEDWL